MTDHREIWLNCKCSEGHGREWCQDPVFARCEECGAEPVKYIRADLACLLDKPEAVEVEPDYEQIQRDARVAADAEYAIGPDETAFDRAIIAAVEWTFLALTQEPTHE